MPHLESALKRKMWENTTAAQALERRMEIGSRAAGVGAVLERQKQVSQSRQRAICLQILYALRNDYYSDTHTHTHTHTCHSICY